MKISEWIRTKLLQFLKIEKLSNNPDDERLTFINDDEAVKMFEVRANKMWFVGSGDELLNFYTQARVNELPNNPIYNRNKRHYFWEESVDECDIKRIHSGIPNAIVTTLTNVIGYPKIKAEGWDKIECENDFCTKLTQQARPLTLVCGWGAWKVNFNTTLSKYPLWEYYDAEDVEYIIKQGLIIGIIYKNYYKKNKTNYLLLETRYRENGNSYIEFNLFRNGKNNDITPCDLSELDELAGLENQVIEGLNKILGVPSRYFYDSLNAKYGKSIYNGKLDLFDMLDEIWSQASQTNRVSTPVEYYSPDVLEHTANGKPMMPQLYNRQFMQKAGVPDGEGNMSNDIITTQPDLNFDKYGGLAKDVLDYILTGVLSPATMGIDVAKKDNADAQREKEKVTIMTRNNIISAETKMLRDIVNLSLMLKEYMETGKITLQEYDVNINYNEFANPSLENEIQVLGSAWSNGQLSTERYVDLLWSDKLSDEDKLKEMQWLDDNRQQENNMMGVFSNDENRIGNIISNAGNEQEEPATSEEQVPINNL